MDKIENSMNFLLQCIKRNVVMFQGYQREAKCQLALGEIATAILLYDKVLGLEPGNSSAKTEV